MRLIDCFYHEGVVDCDTVIFEEQSLLNDYSTVLATRETGHAVSFSLWTEGVYEV